MRGVGGTSVRQAVGFPRAGRRAKWVSRMRGARDTFGMLRVQLPGAGLPTCTQAPSGWYAASRAPAASYQPDQPDQPAPCLTVLKQEELDLKGISHIGGPADADKKVELKPGMLLEQDPDVRVFVMLIFSEGQSLVLGVQQHARISSQAGWFA